MALSKMALKYNFFFFLGQKSQNFVYFRPYDFVQISLECDTYFLRNVWKDFRLPMSALPTVAGKSFNSKFTAKIDFPIGYILCYHCWCWHWKSIKSLHTLFGKYLDHMLVKFEQNRMVQTVQNFELFDKKWLTIFDKVLTPFWKTFLWLKQLFDAKLLI